MAADQATSGTAVSETQTFRSVTALIVWWVWVLFAVGNLVDLAVQGHDHLSLVAAGILIMITGVAYVAAWRPRIIAAADGVTIRNPLRDHRIPWRNVEKADLADLVRVHCRVPGAESGKVINAWAVHYSRRKQFAADARSRRAAARGPQGPRWGGGVTTFGIPQPTMGRSSADLSVPATSAEAEAERIVHLLNDRADAIRADEIIATVEADWDSEATATPEVTGTQATGTPETAVSPVATGSAAPAGIPPVRSNWSRPAIGVLLISALILVICCLA
ncbi:MAG TPA: PH domain-containing protein [Streptosporangiaceae bacterium]|nr:PH domain-containing protein [Streptosporangiaceae bacterium]